MGSAYFHKCTNCGYSVRTSGLWEFYRDKEGNKKPYGHPGPVSKEAEKRGIYGFSANVYCPKCDEVFDLIVVEFEKPIKGIEAGLFAWLGKWEPKEEFLKEGGLGCPKCSNHKLILGPREDIRVMCPRCKEGKLIVERRLIS